MSDRKKFGDDQHPADRVIKMISEAGAEIQRMFDEAVKIPQAFEASESLNLPGSQTDRARHMHWMNELADEYGPTVAKAIGTGHEVQGMIEDFFLRRQPLSDSWEETKRDLKTNDFALRFRPDAEQIEEIVKQLDIDELGRAEAPDPFELWKKQNAN